MNNNWWRIGTSEYIRKLGNDAQYLNTYTRNELLVSLESLQWGKGDAIEELGKEMGNLINPDPTTKETEALAKNRNFMLCKAMVKSLSSMPFHYLDWDAKVSDWRHNLFNYKPYQAIDYLSLFIDCNRKIVDALLWLENNLSEISRIHSNFQWKYTEEMGMSKEDWQRLLNLPAKEIIKIALQQIEDKRKKVQAESDRG